MREDARNNGAYHQRQVARTATPAMVPSQAPLVPPGLDSHHEHRETHDNIFDKLLEVWVLCSIRVNLHGEGVYHRFHAYAIKISHPPTHNGIVLELFDPSDRSTETERRNPNKLPSLIQRLCSNGQHQRTIPSYRYYGTGTSHTRCFANAISIVRADILGELIVHGHRIIYPHLSYLCVADRCCVAVARSERDLMHRPA